MSSGDINRIPSLPPAPSIQRVNPKDDAKDEEEQNQQQPEEENEEEEPQQEVVQDSYEGAAPEGAELTPEEIDALKQSAEEKKKEDEEDDGAAPARIDVQA